MTYCLGILNRFGLVMAADSRTNAGVDYISVYRKLFCFSQPGKCAIALCTSGNLSITQAVITQLQRDIAKQANLHLYQLDSFYEIVRYISGIIREIQNQDRPWLDRDNIDYQSNFLVGGQVKGEPPQLYLIYPQGNFIQSTEETPFLQIGETKYGKPILDRTLDYDTPLDMVAKCALISLDSTMRSNISVGPPLNLILYNANSFEIKHQLQLKSGDPYLLKVRQLWESHLRQAFLEMPAIEWQTGSVDC